MDDDTTRMAVNILCAAVVVAGVLAYIRRTHRDHRQREAFLYDVEQRLVGHRKFNLDLATVNGQLVVAKHTNDAQMAQDAMLKVAELHERLHTPADTPEVARKTGIWDAEAAR